ncbi:FAD binding domain protein [Xylaria digitata]|nr:FAD binding domain protein [Xylaria digitata]
MEAKSVIIVGGSLTGLLHGLYLKRCGYHVVILEQDRSPMERRDHQAGIAIGPSVIALMERYEATGREYVVHASTLTQIKSSQPTKRQLTRRLTNWVLLYRLLRANFDGFSSPACRHPPPAMDGDGRAEFRDGKRVTRLQYDKETGMVHVLYVDVATGEEASISASLVLGADGRRSTVRKLLTTSSLFSQLFASPSQGEYAGYITWRGTVPECDMPSDTGNFFNDQVIIMYMKGSYMVIYVIPTEDGNTTPGSRLVNWAWYYPLPPDSAEMKSVFTDTRGVLHRFTVPKGLVQPQVWSHHLQRFIEQMAPPVAELLSKSTPFVTKIDDYMSSQGSFFDGHVILVGDALAAPRPHIASATEQAAQHCLQLADVLTGKSSLQSRDQQALVEGKSALLRSRKVGLQLLGSFVSYRVAVLVEWWFHFKQKLRARFNL